MIKTSTHQPIVDASETIYRTVRDILRQNDITYVRIAVTPILQKAAGATLNEVLVETHKSLTFSLPLTVFDSKNEIALRVVRHVEELNRVPPTDRHDFIYCWCGHSGRSRADELGDHCMKDGTLSCRACEEEPSRQLAARPIALRCPCCLYGHRPLKSAHDPLEYCKICNGLGYIAPTYYD